MADGPARLDDALEKALSYLQKRDRTAAQVSAKLEALGIDGETAAAAIEELQGQGFIDDARFARLFAEDRRNLDGWGSERIIAALNESGIDEEAIAAALEGRGRDEELADAIALLDRKMAQPPEDDRERERALGLLVRRGYELELAYDAVRAFESAGSRG